MYTVDWCLAILTSFTSLYFLILKRVMSIVQHRARWKKAWSGEDIRFAPPGCERARVIYCVRRGVEHSSTAWPHAGRGGPGGYSYLDGDCDGAREVALRCCFSRPQQVLVRSELETKLKLTVAYLCGLGTRLQEQSLLRFTHGIQRLNKIKPLLGMHQIFAYEFPKSCLTHCKFIAKFTLAPHEYSNFATASAV